MSSSLITRPLSIGELLDVTFRVYRKHFWKLVLTAGGLMVPIQILNYLLGLAILKAYPYNTGMVGMIEGSAEGAPLWVLGVQIALALVVWFLALLTGTAIMWLSNSLLTGNAPGVTESWRAGLGLFLRYLGLIILLGVIGMVVMLGLFIMTIIPCLGLFLMFGGIIGIFYLYVRIILAPMALVADDVGPISAIKNAWYTSKGHFWRIALYGLLLGILAFVFYALPSILIQTWVLMSDFSVETFAILSTVVGIGISLINALWTPLYLLAMMVLYHELRLRNQPGGDIEQRLAALEAEAAPAVAPAGSIASQSETEAAESAEAGTPADAAPAVEEQKTAEQTADEPEPPADAAGSQAEVASSDAQTTADDSESGEETP